MVSVIIILDRSSVRIVSASIGRRVTDAFECLLGANPGPVGLLPRCVDLGVSTCGTILTGELI